MLTQFFLFSRAQIERVMAAALREKDVHHLRNAREVRMFLAALEGMLERDFLSR